MDAIGVNWCTYDKIKYLTVDIKAVPQLNEFLHRDIKQK